jgi:hypothetical protein
MMQGNLAPDPRLAKYRRNQANALEYTISLLKALSDPVATEIDPLCSNVGGHIHAAEVTPDGIKWLIEPLL